MRTQLTGCKVKDTHVLPELGTDQNVRRYLALGSNLLATHSALSVSQSADRRSARAGPCRPLASVRNICGGERGYFTTTPAIAEPPPLDTTVTDEGIEGSITVMV
jgi:hypothetical protein